ncbi:MAG: type II secretion system protein [Proteobacteria bacterium]|nr:type II secretion system protein [Pseudomonadota bacterium]
MKTINHDGFTLVEMAIVLALIALILGTGLTLLSAQQDQRRIEDTKARLNDARDALIGFSIVNGRLPCPANPTIASGTANAGIARTAIATGCTADAVGTIQGDLPWATLGLPETDAWGHRFTYRVTSKFARSTPLFTLSDDGDIDIGSTAAGNDLANNMPAVIVSHGINGFRAYLPSGQQLPASADADETENADIDTNFVSKALTPTFDDQVIWLSQYTLFNRMVQAGKLP